MRIHHFSAGLAGAVIVLGLLGGQAAVAATAGATGAQPQAVAQEILPCAVLDELESTLRELSQTTDPGAVKDRLDVVIESLEEIRTGVPVLLLPVYDSVVAQLKNLRNQLEESPTSDVIRQINGVARQAADLVAIVPCV